MRRRRFKLRLAVLLLVATGLIAPPGRAQAAAQSAIANGYSAVIRRTSHGVPHITGSTLANVMFGRAGSTPRTASATSTTR